MVFLKKKIFPPKNFFLPFFNATFQCGRYGVSEKVKKRASKVAHNRPRPFFPLSSPGHSPQPKIDSPYHEISGPDICSLICDNLPPKAMMHLLRTRYVGESNICRLFPPRTTHRILLASQGGSRVAVRGGR